MEELIAQAKGQFDQILSYIQGDAQNQQLNEVGKGIFWFILQMRTSVDGDGKALT